MKCERPKGKKKKNEGGMPDKNVLHPVNLESVSICYGIGEYTASTPYLFPFPSPAYRVPHPTLSLITSKCGTDSVTHATHRLTTPQIEVIVTKIIEGEKF